MVSATGRDSTSALLRSTVWPFISESKKPLLLLFTSIAAVTATALSHIATPWLVGNLIDAAPRGDVEGLRTAVVGLFAVAVLASAGGGTRALAARRLADLFRAHLRTRLMRQVLRLRLSDLEGRDNRQLNSVFADDVAAVANLANPIALDVLLAVVQLAGALGILLTRFDAFAWVVLLVMPLNAAIGLWQWPLARARAREQVESKTQLDSLTLQVLEGVRDVKSLAADRSLMAQWRALDSADLFARWRAELVRSVDHGRYTATWLIMSVVYFIGGLAVIRGELTIGSLTAFVWYVGFLETPISRLWQSMNGWQRAQASLERYTRVINLEPEIQGAVVLCRSAAPEVEFRNVTFCYPDTTVPALADVKLRFAAGEQIAIVGTSGAGKTTLVSLILRLFDPQDGSVLIDGTDVRQYTLASLRQYVAIISQEPFVFDGTIRHNISVGLEECSESDIRQAAAIADADRFIRDLPEGYDTVLGARGTRLSGGQKRRIAIARAIIRRPRILVLDEVTGALDSVSDLAIQQAISRLRDGCTTITVSHRLSSTLHADMIVVLDQGCVIATGTHQMLLRECAPYRALARLQKLEETVEDAPATGTGSNHKLGAVLPAAAAHHC